MFDTIITAEVLASHLKDQDWKIFDCRFNLADPDSGRVEFTKSHIPGSQYAHLDGDLSSEIIPGKTGRHPLPDPAEFVEQLRRWGINDNDQVVVYDHGHGGIAARLWWMLRWMGHDAVAVLDGGWKGWVDQQLPTTDQLVHLKPGNFQARVRDGLIRQRKEVDAMCANSGYKVVDARIENRYLGIEEPIDPIAGSIPGALNKPWPGNLNAQGYWKRPEDLRAEWMAILDHVPAQNTICYCGSGVTACHDILSIKYAGLGDALLYPGSWSEYLHSL